MNIAFILFLIPTIIVSAFAQFYGPQAVELNASITTVNSLLRSLTLEMGLDTGFLWFSGVLGTVLFGMGLGLLVEYACQVLMRQPYYATNGHGALMGLIVALLMPPSVPAWIVMVAVIVAIFMAKQVFGGIGGYPMHPALVGWLVVYLSWPQYVYPIGTASIAGFNTAVIVMTILGGIGLLITGYIRLEITLGVLIGTLVFAFLLQNSLVDSISEQFWSGHVFLAAFFLATDATCSPANKLAMWIYGLGIGFLIILIRAFGVWPDAVPFAVLLMNIVSPLLDRIKPKVIKMAI
jgi:electron transport complex protein RnfD